MSQQQPSTSRNHIINIENLVQTMGKKLESSSSYSFRNHSIYKVHKKFRKLNQSAYTPELVSIGPFHDRKGSLSAMEEHKLRCMKTFFVRTGTKLEDYVKSMSNLVIEARKCYSEPIELTNSAFLEMMLIDGLFIIDLFEKRVVMEANNAYRMNDHVFNNPWAITSLIRDLFLLENQLPMHFLDELFRISKQGHSSSASSSSSTVIVHAENSSSTVTELALRFFNYLIMPNEYDLKSYHTLKGNHLLDLLGKTFHPSPIPNKPTDQNIPHPLRSIPCVTELRRAGVKFMMRKDSPENRLLNISFENGVLEIPPLSIHDLTESLLINLIAYEQCSVENTSYMTSYAYFMDNLINSAEDVEFLCRKEIMKNTLGNHGDVSDMFNKLVNEVTLEDFYYSELCDEVNTYYNASWHVWRTSLKRDHFKNPWTIISLMAAVVLLVLTVLQTLYSIKSYKLSLKQSPPTQHP